MLEKVKILKKVFVIKIKDISKYYTFSVVTMCLLLLESCREKPEEAKKLSLGNVTAATAAKSLQSCSTLRPHRQQLARLPCPWDSPGKSTGMGCHFLLECKKVKSESEVAQSCPTLRNPTDWSPPGSSVHGTFQARVLEWVAIAFS